MGVNQIKREISTSSPCRLSSQPRSSARCNTGRDCGLFADPGVGRSSLGNTRMGNKYLCGQRRPDFTSLLGEVSDHLERCDLHVQTAGRSLPADGHRRYRTGGQQPGQLQRRPGGRSVPVGTGQRSPDLAAAATCGGT